MTSVADDLTIELGMAEAAEHARRGDYPAALAALGGLESARALDLTARIHAQRGDLDAADAEWARVLALVPDDADAVAGRNLIAEIKAGKRHRPAFVRDATAAVVVVLLVAGAVVWSPSAGTPPAPVAAAPPAPSALPDGVRERLDALEARSAAVTEQERTLDAALDAVAAGLAAPGVQVERRAGDVRVVFDDGLFLPDGARFTADGRRALREWAGKLSGKPVRVTVVGHGVPLADGPAHGGSAVALSRAAAAVAVLVEGSGTPLTAFAVTSADQSEVPHRTADAAAQSRNRTVSLLVTPAG
ncbi:hypothetical protein [Umezawaea sp. Da 62-37]|uniref:hypothetical protein n=1 Tax=Umezawaea sp. Da 62-37 TaxID=3075927 RepID=UPI0028F72BD1|nr:hypothetical protein [Umezawaea sp. Da 62-37]WNV85580.1 hypothetical protein RM788_46930 [Umezawaea sp. Da 62-37]